MIILIIFFFNFIAYADADCGLDSIFLKNKLIYILLKIKKENNNGNNHNFKKFFN